MAVRNKVFIPNEIYFITFTIFGWQPIFLDDKYCGLVYKWFDYMKGNYQNKIHSYVIMPNHIHCLIFISNKSPHISRLIQNAKRFLAYQIVSILEKEKNQELLNYFQQYAKTKYNAKHKIFTDRYDSLIIQSQKLFLEKLNYIHNNPCAKHWNLADSPEDYKYSSASNYIKDEGLYPVDIIGF
ncbi:MAG: hypothetical protein WC323_00990 [Patescibacteria group bacterium]|jgi:putative transposase